MKKILFFSFAVLMTMMASAKPVDPDRAVQVAKNYMAQYVKGADQMTATVVYTHPMPKSGRPAMYVVNVGNRFVLVSADDIAHPVLGYSLSRPWPTATKGEKVSLPSQVSGYLDDLAAQIESAIGQQGASDSETATEWNQLLTRNTLPQDANTLESIDESEQLLTTNLPDSVGPLLTTTWDQGQYYNALCPEDANGPDGHVYTGCVATAMAQIINYWGYPVHGRGIHSYNSNYGTLSVNYDSATYDYTNMPNVLTATSTPAQVNAVATLMRDCGVAAAMGYGSSESSSYDVVARAALINFFRFSPNINYIGKTYFSSSEWNSLLHADLAAGLPILYSGQGSGGHAFVCDGYKIDNYYHFNFGWSGLANGWYLLTAANPMGMEFNSDQKALVGIVPDSTGNVILGNKTGTSYFTINEPIIFYHLLGNNDYWGDAYSNDCHSYVYFSLADTTKHIEADVMQFVDQRVDLIDSIAFVRRDIWFLGNDIYSPFICSTNTIKLEYTGSFFPDGFQIHIGEESLCKPVSQITTVIDTTSIYIAWHENGNASQWEVEYGPAGFSIGQGLMILVNDTNVVIGNLQKDLKYDFYIRAICSDTIFSDWNIVSVQLSPYWTDIVTSVPEGYSEDVEGNIFISSAEGLAWLSIQVNGLHGYEANNYAGRTVFLTQDIDLTGYRWYPIGKYWKKSNDWGYHSFLGTFDGGNHIISNMCVWDTNSMLGLFGAITSGGYGDIDAVIENVKLEGGIVECIAHNGKDPYFLGGWGMLGGLVGNVNGKITIDNCHSSVTVKGRSRIGALCGSVTNMQESYGYIRNCSTNGTIIGYYSLGGIVGDLYGNIILENSYTYGDIIEDTFEVEELWGRGDIGGLVGSLADATVRNCYSISDIIYQTNSYIGLGVGEMYASHPSVKNVYCKKQSNINIVGGNYAGDMASIQDTSAFNTIDWNLDTSVVIQDSSYSTVLGALNAYVIQQNNQELFTWKKDLEDTLAVFSTRFTPSCYNPSNIQISNATQIGDSTISTKVQWDQVGTPNSWEILYVSSLRGIDSGSIVSVNSNPCIIDIFPVGIPLDFYIRAVCDNNNRSNWIGPITYIPDKLHWTEVVTSQPEGYQEDSAGNVYISSAEGLSWLSSVVNELNGCNQNRFEDKQIFLTADIDLSAYRWTPIGGKDWSHQLYCTSFNGNNHTISGLYCNDLADYQGLFGIMNGDVYNLALTQCNIQGENNVGAIAGWAYNNRIVNCSVTGSVRGIENVGGIIGWHQRTDFDKACTIANTCFIGSVSSRRDIVKVNSTAGYIGGVCGVPFDNTIINCYVTSEIANSFAYPGIITGIGGRPYLVSNCYYKDYETSLPITSNNSTITNNSSFSSSGTNWTLNTPPYVNGASYTDLVDALNAWVDAYDTAGIYRHWAADSVNTNGGFPVFATIPCVTVTGSDSIVVCDSYTWHGNIYTSSAELIDTLPTLGGCDSIVTHHLIVNHSVAGTETVAACESYFFGGQWIYASGQYTDTLTNAAGCDSIATLNLTINNPVHVATTEVACDSYTWHGAALITSGNYTYPHDDANGCTQVDTLHLTVNYSNTGVETVTACDSYTWHGTTYTTSNNTHTFTETNAAGCDSTITLHLTINYSAETTVTDTAENSYTWNGTTYTESGIYQWQGTTAEGCDSTVTLILVINQVGIGEIDNSNLKIDIYPNPTTGLLTIDAEDVLSIEVFDPTGRKVATHERTNNIDLAKFPTGTYLLKIHLPSGTSLQRVILK